MLIMVQRESLIGCNEQKNIIESLKIKEQIESQIKILLKSGILETDSDFKIKGIQGIDGHCYPLPNAEEIIKRMDAKREILQKKIEQGFTKLILEPFACSLDELTIKYKKVILQHYENSKILATKEKSTDLDVTAALDINRPIWISEEEYNECDKKNRIVYFPKRFSEMHGGRTKKEILASSHNDAWHFWLVEDMPNIPREGNGKIIENRQQLETNKTPSEYLNLMHTNSVYKNEVGLTPEVDIIISITYLEEKNQVINDYKGAGSISYQLGGYFPFSNRVPDSYWDREDRQANLFYCEPTFKSLLYGVRTGVRI